MKMRTQWLIPLAVLVSACGASTPDEQTEEASYKNLHALHHDLGQGASGEAVRELHTYLARFGYFPNEKLARDYPAWRPVVETPPTDAAVYDRYTEQAVRKLQLQYGLSVTGVVDEPTRAALRLPRCGTPDGIPDMDPSNKFSTEANIGYGIPHPLATYRFNGPWEAADRLRDAIYSWTIETDQEIIPANNPNLTVEYGPLDMSIYGATHFTVAGLTITMNSNVPWYTGSVPSFPPGSPEDITDFQTVVVHELGHALGLGHSGFLAVMKPVTLPREFNRNLAVDDKVGISIKRDSHVIIQGYAPEDIAVGNVEGSVWIINGPDHSMWKWDGGSGFVRDAANGDARAIAVGRDGIPWVGAPWGAYRRTSADPTQGTWQKLSGLCVSDIAASVQPDPRGPGLPYIPAVWLVTCDNNIYKYDNGLFWYQDIVFPRNKAARIALDTAGLPWVVSTDGVVYHRASTDPNSGYYADLPASLPYHADIGVGPCCYGWGVRRFPAGYPGGDVTPFQYQPGEPDVTGYWRWLTYPGQAVKISVGPKGDPWWFDAVGRIWHSRW